MKRIIKQKLYKKDFIIFLQIIMLFQIIIPSISLSECDYYTPIKRKGSEDCIEGNCTPEEFENNICTIENQIVKTQWINNIIYIEDSVDFRYVDISTSQNGNLILLTTAITQDYMPNRIIYKLDKFGSGCFLDEVIPYYKYMLSDYDFYQVTIFSTKSNENFFISLSNQSYFELYNLEDSLVISKFIGNFKISSYIGTFVDLDDDFYVLGFIKKNSIGENYFSIYKCNSTSLELSYQSFKYNNIIDNLSSDAKIVSCFQSDKKKIICFYQEASYNYTEIVFDGNLNVQKTEEIVEGSSNVENFFQCVHFTGEVGAFAYYDNSSKLKIKFKIYNDDDNSITDYFNSIDIIELNIDNLNANVLLNQMIKLKDSKICITSVDVELKELYITIINNYDKQNEKIKIRYYLIRMNNLYIYRFFNRISITIYNGLIALASTYIDLDDCSAVSLILFSYPNSTDFEVDIIEKLKINDNIIIDLNSKCNLDNNIFGLIYKDIKIISFSEEFKLFSSKDNRELNVGDTINEDENIILSNSEILSFPNDGNITFTLETTEPEFNVYNEYAQFTENIGGDDTESNFFKPNTYTGKYSYCTIIINEIIYDNCIDNCKYCLSDENCIVCKYGFRLTDNEDTKICLDKEEVSEETTEYIVKTSIPFNNDKNISINQIENIKNELLKNHTIKNEIIKKDKVTIQLSTLEHQKHFNEPEVSTIDLGECENKLKEAYSIPKEESLFILKVDIKTEDLSSTYVQYEVYDPTKTKQLNLSICEGISINIDAPVNLDDLIELIYDSLSDSGYNLFNENDSFYQDICAVYTTVNGTDILLSDRKKDIYAIIQNKSLCQTGCELKSYNSSTNKASCNCEINQKTITDLNIDNLFDEKKIASNFYDTLANSNFQVLKCIKLIFSSKFGKNIGGIVMTILLFISIILNIFSFIKGKEIIHIFINLVIKNNILNENKDSITINNNKSTINNKRKSSIISRKKKSKTHRHQKRVKIEANLQAPTKKRKKKKQSSIYTDIIDRNRNDFNISLNTKSNLTRNGRLDTKKNTNISNIINIQNIEKEKNSNHNDSSTIHSKIQNDINNHKDITIYTDNKLNNITQKKGSFEYNSINNTLNPNLNKNNSKDNNNNKYLQELNDEELNNLEYELAVEQDKRTYFQYYWSLLKKKHLILFAFWPSNDYNVMTMKISLFILSFGLYFTINGFFFNDETMHKVYKDNGAFDFLFQIPQILYSTIVSAIINMILKRLSLSEKNILEIKQEKDNTKIVEKSKTIEKCINIKFIIFFILSFLFMLFFSYFISCFCAVYINTQKILIKDTLISFGLSMIYPFGLNLLPGFFRIPALRAKKKDNKCLYKLSKIVALI